MASDPQLELEELQQWFSGIEPMSGPQSPASATAPVTTQNVCTPRSGKELPMLTSPRARKPILSPKKRNATQRRWFGEESGIDVHRVRNSHESELEQLRGENERLRQELQSLRDMYAKHTAYTELKCDRLLREKDQECADWYKTRKLEIKKLQSALQIMHALFRKKETGLVESMETDRTDFAETEENLMKQVSSMKAEHESEMQRLRDEHKEHVNNHQAERAELHRQKAEVASKASSLEQLLDDSRRDHERLKEESRQQSKELVQVKDKLVQAEKNVDMERRERAADSTMAELENTRRMMKEGWKKDVEKLNQELMDYVRFIVHILPDNWTETDAFNKVPPQLREQLSWMKSGQVRDNSRGKTPGAAHTSRHLGRGLTA